MKPEASLKPDYLGDKRTDKLCARGVIGCNAAIGCGSEERMAAIKLAWLFPANAGLPVAIS